MMRIKKFLTILLTIAMVVSLLPATAFAANNTATTMRLAKTQGTIAVTNSTGKKVTQTKNMKLYNGYKMKAGAKSYAWISLDDTKVAKLDANSSVEVQKSGKALTLYLSSGNLFFNVKDPLKSGETFSIKTSTMTMGIRGTSGCVRVISDRVTEVHLLTGEVMIYTEHPGLGVSKTAVLKAGQKATSLIDWEAMEVSGEMAEIMIEKLENHEICGICSEEIANDPELLERIKREAPHLLPEKAAAEAGERIAADEAEAEAKQAEIDAAVAEQVFPEDVDPYFEEEAGGGGGGTSVIAEGVATWADLLRVIREYNGGSGVTNINLTADIAPGPNDDPLPAIENMGPLTLNLGKNTLTLNDTLVNNSNLTITNVDGTIVGPGADLPVLENNGTLVVKDATIDGNGSNGIQQKAGILTVESAVTFVNCYAGIDGQAGTINLNNPTFENITFRCVDVARATLNLKGLTTAGNMQGYELIYNEAGTVKIAGGKIYANKQGGAAISNNGTLEMTAGEIYVTAGEAYGISNSGNATISGGKITVEDGAAGAYGVQSSGTLLMNNRARVYAYDGTGVNCVSGSATLDTGAAVYAYYEAWAVDMYGGDSQAALTRPVKATISAEHYIEENDQKVMMPFDEYMDVEVIDSIDDRQAFRLIDNYGQVNGWAAFVAEIDSFNEGYGDATITLQASLNPTPELIEAYPLPGIGNPDEPGDPKTLTIELGANNLTLPSTLYNYSNSNLVFTGTGTITTEDADVMNGVLISNDGSLTLNGPKIIVPHDVVGVNNMGTFNMESGSLQINNNASIQVNSSSTAVAIRNFSTFVMNSGTIEVTGVDNDSTTVVYAVYDEGGTVNIAGGNITATSGMDDSGAALGNAYALYFAGNDVQFGIDAEAAVVRASTDATLWYAENYALETFGVTISEQPVNGYYQLITFVAGDSVIPVDSEVKFAEALAVANGTKETPGNDVIIQLTSEVTLRADYDYSLGGYDSEGYSYYDPGILTIDLAGNDLILNTTFFNDSGELNIIGPGRVLAGSEFATSDYNSELIRNLSILTWNGATMHLTDGLVGIDTHGTLNMTNCTVTAETDAVKENTIGVVYYQGTTFNHSGESCADNVTFSEEREEA